MFSNNSNEPSQGVGLCTGDYDKTCFGKSGRSHINLYSSSDRSCDTHNFLVLLSFILIRPAIVAIRALIEPHRQVK